MCSVYRPASPWMAYPLLGSRSLCRPTLPRWSPSWVIPDLHPSPCWHPKNRHYRYPDLLVPQFHHRQYFGNMLLGCRHLSRRRQELGAIRPSRLRCLGYRRRRHIGGDGSQAAPRHPQRSSPPRSVRGTSKQKRPPSYSTSTSSSPA